MLTKWKVYVTRLLPPKVMEALYDNPDLDVEVNSEDRPLTRMELLEKVKGCDAVITQLVDKIDAEVMDAAKGVKIFANFAVGYDNIDVAAATARGIFVTNTPDVLTNTTLPWILTYDNTPEIIELYRDFNQYSFNINYSVANKRVGSELLITSTVFNQLTHHRLTA